VQSAEEILPAALKSDEKKFGLSVRRKALSARFQCTALSRIVVDLAIHDHEQRSIAIRCWLLVRVYETQRDSA
jgi:hypothetical protein